MNIALLGYGTVGSGVYELMNKNKKMLKDIYSKDVTIKKILVRNKAKYQDLEHFNLFVDDFDAIKNDNIDVLISVMGGLEPSYDYIKYALEHKIHVITANKDLIAENYKELLNLAQKNNVNLNYEASVAGGIPILKTIKNNLKGNHIQGIFGIINGTTNFILSQMYDNNMNYEEVLKIAQEKGFAEADPTSDVEGLDASRKLAILSMLTFDVHIPWKKIKTEGITKIDKDDINYAKQLDKKIKLLGISKLSDQGIYASVRPVYIHKQNAISKIDNEFNGIYLESPLTGDLMFYGKGAGKFPTASAIFGDLLDIIQHIEKRDYYYMFKDSKMIDYYPEKTNWFVRIKTSTIANSTNEIFSVFKNYKLDLKTNNDAMEITIKIYDVFEQTLVEKLKELSTQDAYKYFLILNDGDADVNH